MDKDGQGKFSEFLKNIESYQPAVPDSVSLYFMKKNGIQNPDPRIVRLFALASQKFISDIVLDAMQQARIKGLGQIRKGTREQKFCLTEELLDETLQEYGISTEKAPYLQ